MVHILLEENYADNNRIDLIVGGIQSIVKKRRIGIKIYKSMDEIKDGTRVVILICASMSWATEAIALLNERGIHPLLFGFQYLDSMYQYSCITLTYTKTTYLLTGYLLSLEKGNTAVLGYNSDSLPDNLKLLGARHAAEKYGVPLKIFRNDGNLQECLDDFAQNGEDVKNIICLNDSIAVILDAFYPHLLCGRRMCSCSGMKISEFLVRQYPMAKIDYYKAGERLAELYLFLLRCGELSSTVMTLEMDISIGKENGGSFPPIGIEPVCDGVDFYGDKLVHEVEGLEHMLLACDESDMDILRDILCDFSYETIAEKRHFALNTVKYRVHAMIKNAEVSTRKELVSLIEKYHLDFGRNE